MGELEAAVQLDSDSEVEWQSLTWVGPVPRYEHILQVNFPVAMSRPHAASESLAGFDSKSESESELAVPVCQWSTPLALVLAPTLTGKLVIRMMMVWVHKHEGRGGGRGHRDIMTELGAQDTNVMTELGAQDTNVQSEYYNLNNLR